MKQCCALMRSDGTMVEELWFAWHDGDEGGVSRGKASWRDGDGAKLADHVFYGEIWDDTGRFHKLFNFLCFVLLDSKQTRRFSLCGCCRIMILCNTMCDKNQIWYRIHYFNRMQNSNAALPGVPNTPALLLLSRRKVKRRGIIRLHSYPTKPTLRLPKEVGNRL